jgi:hypothetical protein
METKEKIGHVTIGGIPQKPAGGMVLTLEGTS